MRRDCRFCRIIASLAIISDTTSPAPLCFTRRRNGRSVTPDIGARITGSSSFTGPIWMLTFSSLVWLAQILSRVIGRRVDAAKQKKLVLD
jgi:hypothetical protein